MSDRTVIWHEVECGSYAADLALWEELARRAPGPILELGCGAGRVALHLAERGCEVLGIDTDSELVAVFNERARTAGIPARAIVADATGFDLGERFALALAPMQLAQILGGRGGRRAMLARVAAHLEPKATLAVALVESRQLPAASAGDGSAAPLPDVREQDDWVFSSLPRAVRRKGGRLLIERLRQTVSPDGEISEEVDITELDPLSPAQLESDAREAGLLPDATRKVPATHWHVGSTVCILEAP